MISQEHVDPIELSIAVIEDDKVDYHWIGGLLRHIPEINCEFSWAQSFEEGEVLLKEKPHDIAFIDHAIGKQSGLDIVRKFGGRDAETPMVMLTGAGNRVLDCEAMDAGVYDFLDKSSIDPKELERTIRYTLKTHKLEQELKRALNAAEKADKAKSNFLAHLSHDLKTPLNAIVGFAELISLDKTSPNATRNYADQIYSSGRHLTDMIEDLLTLTYFDMQKAECNPRLYQVSLLFDEALRLTHYTAMERSVAVKTTCATDELTIYGDRKALRRILVNLISVSIKHSREGGIIYIASAEDEEGTSILVSDDGCGISQKTLEEVMSAGPYSRDAYNTTGNGVGLSLSIVHQYILMHNAKMKIDSKENGGTVIELFFPKATD